MNIEEIEKLENQFDISFPQDYTDILLNYPLSEDSEELISSYEDLKNINEDIRENGYWEVTVPKNFWLIGLDGMGGGDFINAEETELKVYIFDHACPPENMEDDGQLRPRLFKEHIKNMVEADINYQNEEKLRKEKKRIAQENKKWWQFWL